MATKGKKNAIKYKSKTKKNKNYEIKSKGKSRGKSQGKSKGKSKGKRKSKGIKHKGGGDEEEDVCGICDSPEDMMTVCASGHRICESCFVNTVSNQCPYCRLPMLSRRQEGEEDEGEDEDEDDLLRELREATTRYNRASSIQGQGQGQRILSSMARMFHR